MWEPRHDGGTSRPMPVALGTRVEVRDTPPLAVQRRQRRRSDDAAGHMHHMHRLHGFGACGGRLVSPSGLVGGQGSVAQLVISDRVKAAERRRQRVERWAHGRLVELADELRGLGVDATVDWGRTAWEPCLHLDRACGRERVWCRPVAVRADGDRAVYRWRFCWNDDPRLIGSCTYPASDVPRAARRIAALAWGDPS